MDMSKLDEAFSNETASMMKGGLESGLKTEAYYNANSKNNDFAEILLQNNPEYENGDSKSRGMNGL